MFVFAGAPTNQSFFIIQAHYGFSEPELQYRYSNLAHWAVPTAGSQSA